jgi:hypothetical protein
LCGDTQLSAKEVFKPKNKPKKDKYGKVIREDDLARASGDPVGSEGSPESEQKPAASEEVAVQGFTW